MAELVYLQRMGAKLIAWAVIVLGSCILASGQTPVSVPGYNCPSTCDANPNCYCASYDVPGGLDASQIPQFIVITNDDAVTVVTQPVILNITDKHQNQKNGCSIPATWFVSINYTDANLVEELYMKNHEIATHTLHHPENPDLTEIVGAKLWLNQTAHVPLEKLRGFRSPFLYFDEQQRTILQQNGFLYDSTISEQWPTATSPGPGQRLWPYTMDYGLPQRCDLSTGTCAVNESHPGLWEFPLWDCQDDTGAVIASMDPPGNLYDVYKREFDRVYNGNRAPLGIYLHAARLLANPSTIDELNQFIDYALGQPNVWFATISQVIEWIKDPVPAANYTYNEGCKAPTDMWFPSGHFCKEVTCVHGNWSDVTCSCSCAGGSLPNQPGFCQDDTGACTVAKVYDDSTRTFYCPGQPSDTPVASPSPAVNPTEAAQTPSCGHPLLNFVGLGISGTEDNAQLYTNAVQAVDGLCTSCAVANSTTGNYFMIALPEPTPIQSVYVVTGNSLSGAYIFAGNSSSNAGLSNPACAEKFDVAAASPSLISCSATATYITLATSGDLELCDIYVVTPDSAAINTSNLDLPAVAPPSPAAAVAPAPSGSRRLLF